MMKIAPSLLSADFMHLERDVQMLNGAADFIHLDIMDGTFVPNISFGFSVTDRIGKYATIPMDAHLMVVNPWKWFSRLRDNGMRMVSFHLEAAAQRTGECLDELHDLGLKAGVVINPDVPVEKLFPYIGQADFFLLMSVFAGFGGQKFIPESISRVEALKAELRRRGDGALIEIDGGIGPANAAAVREAGADIAVAGSSVFKAEDPSGMIKRLREA